MYGKTTKKCKDCLFFDQCGQRVACSNYYPIGRDAEDALLQEMVESSRLDYIDAWNTYTRDN